MALDPLTSGKQLPRQPRRLQRRRVEQEKGAVEAQRRLPPFAVGDQQVAGEVGSVDLGRQQDRLSAVVGPAGKPMWKEARLALVPELTVKPGEQGVISGDNQQPMAIRQKPAAFRRNDAL